LFHVPKRGTTWNRSPKIATPRASAALRSVSLRPCFGCLEFAMFPSHLCNKPQSGVHYRSPLENLCLLVRSAVRLIRYGMPFGRVDADSTVDTLPRACAICGRLRLFRGCLFVFYRSGVKSESFGRFVGQRYRHLDLSANVRLVLASNFFCGSHHVQVL
jgi:hypothetical protein